MRTLRLLVLAATLATGCSGGGSKTAEAPRDPNAPAGEVVAIDGDVTAKRASATTSRALALDADVFADDHVTTGASSTVQIRLTHNEALWTLGESKTQRVDASVAWSAPKQSGGDLVLMRDDRGDRTRAAARSGSQEGVASGESAMEEAPVPAAASADRGEEGQMGKRENPRSASAYGMPSSDPMPPPKPVNEAANAKAIQDVFGGSNTLLSDKAALSDSLANQTGTSSTEGVGGLGIKGTGQSGGGTGDGTIGIGNMGTIGKGAGGSGYGSGSGSLGGRGDAQKVTLGGVTTTPGDRQALVKKVVQQNWNQIRYCVEQAWTRNPSLAGKITVKFAIDAKGKVVSSAIQSATGGFDETSRACVTQRFLRWQFPAFAAEGLTLAEATVIASVEDEAPAETPAATPSAP